MPKSGDIDINKQGFTDEEYDQLRSGKKNRAKKELTEEENALKEKKKTKTVILLFQF